jgi:cold shock CspA family protein
MTRAMIFIDGTWLYLSTPRLADDYGTPELHLDYGLLPRVLGDQMKEQLGLGEIDIVRTCLFASHAINYDLRDEEMVERHLAFFDMLKEDFHYEVELYPIDFRGQRLRRKDRDPETEFEPKEKCVDVALASTMMYYAAIPSAYDIAIVVAGDRDYLPLLQNVRRLGKRVAIVSIRGCCTPDFSDPANTHQVRDTDIIWLNDIIPQIELKWERRQLECRSPLHEGNRLVWTTFRPRTGQPFYCPECRKKRNAMLQESSGDTSSASMTPSTTNEPNGNGHPDRDGEGNDDDSSYYGVITKVFKGNGYGFIRSETEREYFFHLTDLKNAQWEQIDTGLRVSFSVEREPSLNPERRAGAASNVWIV